MIIDEIKALCRDDTIKLTAHVLGRMDLRNIRYSEVMETINNGEVIEDYPTAYPHPACLILGRTQDGRPLHVCVGTDGANLWIITAYEPDVSEWSEDLRIRKEEDTK